MCIRDRVRAFFEEYGKGLWWTYDTSYIPSEGTANGRDKAVSYTHLDVYKRQLLCGANESPLQAGSSSAEISQLFLIDMLYTEYYRTYYDKCSINNEKTSASVMAKLC